MQRTQTKASGGGYWWWAAAAAAAIGLALYGWVLPTAHADDEPPPDASRPPSPPQTSIATTASVPLRAQVPHRLATPPPAASATAPMVVTAASSVVRRVRALPLALPDGAPTPLLMLGQSTVEVVAKRVVEVAPGRTQALLTLRDPQSGQIHYRLSVLRVELRTGADPQALVQAVAGSRLEFSNQAYALLEVEPEKLDAAYRQLLGDSRVLSVNLKAYTPPALPK